MRIKILVALAGLALLAGGPAAAAGREEPFVVVVNAANPVTTLTRNEISQLFLKKIQRWPSGDPVRPVDVEDGSALRDSFSQKVHRRDTAAIKAYWQRLIFSGHEVPPLEEASVAETLAYVRANRGAIAYLPARAALGDQVKVVAVTF